MASESLVWLAVSREAISTILPAESFSHIQAIVPSLLKSTTMPAHILAEPAYVSNVIVKKNLILPTHQLWNEFIALNSLPWHTSVIKRLPLQPLRFSRLWTALSSVGSMWSSTAVGFATPARTTLAQKMRREVEIFMMENLLQEIGETFDAHVSYSRLRYLYFWLRPVSGRRYRGKAFLAGDYYFAKKRPLSAVS